MFKVEMRTISGWADAEWTIDEKPARFETREQAGIEIRDHVADCRKAVKDGNMDSAPRLSDFRVVEAK